MPRKAGVPAGFAHRSFAKQNSPSPPAAESLETAASMARKTGVPAGFAHRSFAKQNSPSPPAAESLETEKSAAPKRHDGVGTPDSGPCLSVPGGFIFLKND
jgi:hypothetical protein